MIVSFETPEERRNTRIKLYKDDVFLIAQEAINKLETSIPLEDLFASADQFTSFLLDNDLSDRDILQYEIDDLREELSDDQTLYILLSLSFVKLCALRKVKSNAENVARALVWFCQEYDGFTDLLKLLSKKEKEMWISNKRVDLLTYELKCIEKEIPTIDGMTVVSSIVDSAVGLSVEGMQHVENALSEVNDKFGHRYQQELNRLRKTRKKKSESKVEIGEQHNNNCQQFMGNMDNPKFITPQQDEAV
jgi:hypothetical protein